MRVALVVAGVVGIALSAVSCAIKSPSEQNSGNNGGASKYAAEDGTVTEYLPPQRTVTVDFSGELVTGGSFDLAQRRGRVVVINFWYASCPPCRKEAPGLEATYRLFKERDVDMVGINIRDEAATAKAFIGTFGISYPNIVDSDGAVLHSLSQFVPGRAIPTTLVLDRRGRVAARILGAAEQSTLKSLVGTVLKEEA